MHAHFALAYEGGGTSDSDPGIGARLFLSARSNQTGPTVPQKALGVSRAISFAIHKDLVVRVLGGF